MLQQLIAREIEIDPARRCPDEACDHPRDSTCWCRKGSSSAERSRIRLCAAALARLAASSPTPASARRMRRLKCNVRLLQRSGMTVGCVNPGAPRLARLGKAGQLLVHPIDPARSRRPDPLVERGPANDLLCQHRRPGLGALLQRRAARLSFHPNQPRARRQMDRPYRRRGRTVRYVSSGLGDASCPTWPKRRATLSAPSKRSVLDPEQPLDTEPERRGKLDRQCRGRGEHAVFDRFTVLRVTPTLSASSAWVSPSSLRRSFSRLQSVQPSRSARRSSMPKLSSAVATATVTMMCTASLPLHRFEHVDDIEDERRAHGCPEAVDVARLGGGHGCSRH